MSLINYVEKLYTQEIYPYHVRYADYVDICVGDERTCAPAGSALLALQLAAREVNFTGKVRVEYKLNANGKPEYNVFRFTNGTVTGIDRFCSYTIYGQDQILKQLKLA